MKRATLLSILGLVIIVAVIVLARSRRKSEPPAPTPPPAQIATTTNESVATNALTATPQPVSPSTPPRKLPVGWEHFLTLKPGEQLNRVTAAMENHTLPADVLVFFEEEIFNRKHMAVTRNNMANAMVWQEQPNPQLHLLFIKMLEDTTEDPLWRDYCLQFLSECLKSTSDPEAVKDVIVRYSQGKDGIAGTAIVNLAFQEGEGRLQNDEAFSRQIEAQLVDPEVALPTRMSILGVIGKRKDVRLLPVVRDYASNTNDTLRRTAIATLGLMGSAEDLPLIEKGLTDKNRAVQLAAKAAVERVKGRAAAAAE